MLSQNLRKVLYTSLLTSGKLSSYLADIDRQAEKLFSRLVKRLSEKEGVTETLKAESQMLWVQKMNNLRNAAMEIVSNELVYSLNIAQGGSPSSKRRLNLLRNSVCILDCKSGF